MMQRRALLSMLMAPAIVRPTLLMQIKPLREFHFYWAVTEAGVSYEQCNWLDILRQECVVDDIPYKHAHEWIRVWGAGGDWLLENGGASTGNVRLERMWARTSYDG